jgi:hypothetical protein
MVEPKSVTPTVLRIKTTVLPEHKIEISNLNLSPGEAVEVIILLPQVQQATERRSALDILDEASGHRIFKTAEQVDAYVLEERQTWDR